MALLGVAALAATPRVAAASLSPLAQEQETTPPDEDQDEKKDVAQQPEDNIEHQDETGRFVEVGDFDKSYRIPGTSVSLRFSGYAKLDFIQDLDPIGNQDQFQTSTIPVERTPGPSLVAARVPEKGLMGAAMTELDDEVGALLKELDDLGIADNTIVLFTADNGGMKWSWPDGQTSPFQGEKATTWEAGVRVPALLRWPGVVKPDTVINDIFGANDWMPTFLAAAGDPDIGAKLLKGYTVGDKTYKVHLDGYDQTALLSGKGPGAREEYYYITDDGDFAAIRYKDWKVSFLTQQCNGMNVWDCDYKPHRLPIIVNLRRDPFESAQQTNATMGWQNFMFRRTYMLLPAAAKVKEIVKSYEDYPPRSKPASFSVGDALNKLTTPQHN